MPATVQLLLIIEQSEYLRYRHITAPIFWNYNLINILSGKLILLKSNVFLGCIHIRHERSFLRILFFGFVIALLIRQ